MKKQNEKLTKAVEKLKYKKVKYKFLTKRAKKEWPGYKAAKKEWKKIKSEWHLREYFDAVEELTDKLEDEIVVSFFNKNYISLVFSQF